MTLTLTFDDMVALIGQLQTEMAFLRNSNSELTMMLLETSRNLKMPPDQTMKDLPALAATRQAQLDLAAGDTFDVAALETRATGIAASMKALLPSG